MDNPLYDHTNKEQIRAANPNISIWATANAGAGKTKVLIDRIARILLKGTEPEKILAVTYTKASAAEMTNRFSFATQVAQPFCWRGQAVI